MADKPTGTMVARAKLVEIARTAAGGLNRPSYVDDPSTFEPHAWVIEAMQVAVLEGFRLGQSASSSRWARVDDDTAFAPPFGTVRKCVDCGCLVAGGPTRCGRCASHVASTAARNVVRSIYLASSWRNEHQPRVLAELRAHGFAVYDFRNPAPGNSGFRWSECDPGLESDLTVERLRRALAHPVAVAGFELDFGAMRAADACVLLLPSGMSAHLEAGWISGTGKPVVVLAPEIRKPELMYKLVDTSGGWAPIFETSAEVAAHLKGGAFCATTAASKETP